MTCAAGVPTIWTLLYQHLKEKKDKPYDLSSLHTILVGGAAASRTLMESFEKDFGIPVLHAWGMTETSPIGTVSRLKATMERLDRGAASSTCVSSRASRSWGSRSEILGDQGEDLPWDGEHVGELVVRGPWIARSYYNNPEAAGCVHRRRLVPHRRHGDDRPARLRADHRPQERPDQAQGRVDLERGHGEPGAGASGRARGGRGRAASTRSATRCRSSSSSSATTSKHPVEAQDDHRSDRHASSPSGSCPVPRTSTSSRRCPRPASASSTRR